MRERDGTRDMMLMNEKSIAMAFTTETQGRSMHCLALWPMAWSFSW